MDTDRNLFMEFRGSESSVRLHKCIHRDRFLYGDRREERQMKKGLELLARIVRKNAERADGRASEAGIYQPKRPEKKQK